MCVGGGGGGDGVCGEGDGVCVRGRRHEYVCVRRVARVSGLAINNFKSLSFCHSKLADVGQLFLAQAINLL